MKVLDSIVEKYFKSREENNLKFLSAILSGVIQDISDMIYLKLYNFLNYLAVGW